MRVSASPTRFRIGQWPGAVPERPGRRRRSGVVRSNRRAGSSSGASMHDRTRIELTAGETLL